MMKIKLIIFSLLIFIVHNISAATTYYFPPIPYGAAHDSSIDEFEKTLDILFKKEDISFTVKKASINDFYYDENALMIFINRYYSDLNKKDDEYIIDKEKITKLITILLDNGADPNMSNRFGQSAYTYAIAKNINNDDFIIKLLEKSGAKHDIFSAATLGDINLMKSFLSKKVDINERDRLDQSPLFYAIANDQDTILQMLINNGADINIKNKDKISPLEYAAKYAKTGAVASLTNINAEDKNEALLWAINLGYEFDQHMTSTNSMMYDPSTDFHGDLAEYIKTIRILLDNGADPNDGDISKKRNFSINFVWSFSVRNISKQERPLVQKFFNDFAKEHTLELDSKEKKGYSAREIAESWNNEDVINFINHYK